MTPMEKVPGLKNTSRTFPCEVQMHFGMEAIGSSSCTCLVTFCCHKKNLPFSVAHLLLWRIHLPMLSPLLLSLFNGCASSKTSQITCASPLRGLDLVVLRKHYLLLPPRCQEAVTPTRCAAPKFFPFLFASTKLPILPPVRTHRSSILPCTTPPAAD